jgi:hypothetical protein
MVFVEKKTVSAIMLTLLISMFIFVSLDFNPLVQAQSGITRVQGNARGTSTSDNISVTLASTPTYGDVLIATISAYGPARALDDLENVSSITETGVTWTQQVQWVPDPQSPYFNPNVNNPYVGIWLGKVASGASPDIVINLHAAAWEAIADVCEYSGVSTTLDRTATARNFDYYTSTGTTYWTWYSQELWIGAIAAYGVSQTNPTNGFTLLDGATYGSSSIAYLERMVNWSAPNAYSGTTLHGVYSSIGCIATFLQIVYVSFFPDSTIMQVGQTQELASSAVGDYTPCIAYQWYVNDSAVSGATTDTWNFTPATIGIYNIYLIATDSLNNTGQSETVTINVTFSGDINGDFRVNLADLLLLANAYGSSAGDVRWNPMADIDGNGIVNLVDLVTLAIHYGQHYP